MTTVPRLGYTGCVGDSGRHHEDLSRSHGPVQGGSARSFGFVFAALFAIVGLVPLVFGDGNARWVLVLIGGVIFAVALVRPGVLQPLNRGWIALGLLLQRIVSPIMLGVVFFGVVLPTGLIMRALRRDLLRLAREPEAETYWIVREPPGPDPESLYEQF